MPEPLTSRAILIKVRNAAELARAQGAIATFAQALVPATIEAKVYDEMKNKLSQSLKDNNVDADIQIVDPTKYKPAGNSYIAHDVVVGMVAIGGVLGLLALVYKFVAGRKK